MRTRIQNTDLHIFQCKRKTLCGQLPCKDYNGVNFYRGWRTQPNYALLVDTRKEFNKFKYYSCITFYNFTPKKEDPAEVERAGSAVPNSIY